MWLRATFGVLLLTAGASCVPTPEVMQATAATKPIRDPRLLLTKLGLQVPDGPLVESVPLATRRAVAAAPPFVESVTAPDDAERARDCLTAAVYYEARSEAPDGQRAVAQVVLNRVRNRAFPNTICGVVYQGSNRRTGCQFSFTCDGSLYRPREPGAWERARVIAAAALEGSVFEPIGSATSYHTTAILPWWAPSLARVATIGAHVFYRWRSNVENALAFGQRYAGVEPVIGRTSSSPAPEAVAATFGVAVHYGNADVVARTPDEGDAQGAFGVAVHRGGARAVNVAAPVIATERTQAAHGVQVHFGLSMASDAPPLPAES